MHCVALEQTCLPARIPTTASISNVCTPKRIAGIHTPHMTLLHQHDATRHQAVVLVLRELWACVVRASNVAVPEPCCWQIGLQEKPERQPHATSTPSLHGKRLRDAGRTIGRRWHRRALVLAWNRICLVARHIINPHRCGLECGRGLASEMLYRGHTGEQQDVVLPRPKYMSQRSLFLQPLKAQ